MRHRNRALLADITDLCLNPKKPYTKVSKTGHLVADFRKEAVDKKTEVAINVSVEKPVVTAAILSSSISSLTSSLTTEKGMEATLVQETFVEKVETSEVVEEVTTKVETSVKVPFNNKKKKK
jgi:hypothetical protein